jgi:hypothetical protein
VTNRQIQRDKSKNCCLPEAGRREEWGMLMGIKFSFLGEIFWNWIHNLVNTLKATELYALKGESYGM